MAPPDPIPNSEVKRFSADGSVGFPHVRVGHRQVLFQNPMLVKAWGFLFSVDNNQYIVFFVLLPLFFLVVPCL